MNMILLTLMRVFVVVVMVVVMVVTVTMIMCMCMCLCMLMVRGLHAFQDIVFNSAIEEISMLTIRPQERENFKL